MTKIIFAFTKCKGNACELLLDMQLKYSQVQILRASLVVTESFFHRRRLIYGESCNINVYESIITGLKQAVDYANGNCPEAKVDKIKSDNLANAKMLVKNE